MKIRPAVQSDLDAVAAIEASWPAAPGWTKAQFSAELSSDRAIFLAAEENELAGYALAWAVPPEAQLLTIAVARASARRGVAEALLSALAGAARQRGLERLTLEVSEKNEPARALYAKAGLRVVGRRPKFYNDGAAALLMDLPL